MAIERLMVAAPLDATEVGQEFDSFHPHVTIFPWFELPASNWVSFDTAMQKLTNGTPQPVIKGGDSDLFGAEQTIPVRRLNHPNCTFNNEQGAAIHKLVHQAVCRYGGDFDPTYIGRNWQPHVSDTREFSLAEDQEIALPELMVVRRINTGRRMVRAIYKWEMASAEPSEALIPMSVSA